MLRFAVMWRAEGKGEVYGYVPTYEGQCTKDTNANNSVICHDNFGQSFDRGSFTFETGKQAYLRGLSNNTMAG